MMIFGRRRRVNRTRQHYDILERVVSVQAKKRRGMLGRLKGLNKDLLVALSIELKLL